MLPHLGVGADVGLEGGLVWVSPPVGHWGGQQVRPRRAAPTHNHLHRNLVATFKTGPAHRDMLSGLSICQMSRYLTVASPYPCLTSQTWQGFQHYIGYGKVKMPYSVLRQLESEKLSSHHTKESEELSCLYTFARLTITYLQNLNICGNKQDFPCQQ